MRYQFLNFHIKKDLLSDLTSLSEMYFFKVSAKFFYDVLF